MLDALKSWVTNIICVVFFVTLVELIIPEGKTKKYVNLITGILVVLVIISPLTKVFGKKIVFEVPDFDIPKPIPQEELNKKGENINKIQSEQIMSLYKSKIEESIRKEIGSINGITCKKVECRISDGNGVETGTISEVSIFLSINNDKKSSKIAPIKIKVGKEKVSDKGIGIETRNEINRRVASVYNIKPGNIKMYIEE